MLYNFAPYHCRTIQCLYSAKQLDLFAWCVRPSRPALSRFTNALKINAVSFIHLFSAKLQKLDSHSSRSRYDSHGRNVFNIVGGSCHVSHWGSTYFCYLAIVFV